MEMKEAIPVTFSGASQLSNTVGQKDVGSNYGKWQLAKNPDFEVFMNALDEEYENVLGKKMHVKVKSIFLENKRFLKDKVKQHAVMDFMEGIMPAWRESFQVGILHEVKRMDIDPDFLKLVVFGTACQDVLSNERFKNYVAALIPLAKYFYLRQDSVFKLYTQNTEGTVTRFCCRQMSETDVKALCIFQSIELKENPDLLCMQDFVSFIAKKDFFVDCISHRISRLLSEFEYNMYSGDTGEFNRNKATVIGFGIRNVALVQALFNIDNLHTAYVQTEVGSASEITEEIVRKLSEPEKEAIKRQEESYISNLIEFAKWKLEEYEHLGDRIAEDYSGDVQRARSDLKRKTFEQWKQDYRRGSVHAASESIE